MPVPATTAEVFSEPSDDQLVRETLAGRTEAYSLLTRRHFATVHAIAYARVWDRDVAEDLTQEVFLRAFLALAELRRPERFRAWVNQIARNLALNWVRDHRSSSALTRMVGLEDLSENIADRDTPRIDETMEAQEAEAAVRSALADLPADLREVVILHYVEGLSKSEIARSLGVHDSTIGRQLGRAVALMRDAVAPLFAEVAPSIRPRRSALARAVALTAAAGGLSPAARAALEGAAGPLAADLAAEVSAGMLPSLVGRASRWARAVARSVSTALPLPLGWPLWVGLAVMGALAALLLIRAHTGAASEGYPPGYPRQITNSIGMILRLIPAGSFLMGSPPSEIGRSAQEGPQHRVTLDAFYMGAHEVTVEAYGRFLAATGYPPPPLWTTHQAAHPDFPALHVGWMDAVAFCEWLSRVEKGTYTLPTEAQWEYACRAGTEGPFGVGDGLTREQANFDPEGGIGDANPPRAVGQSAPNAWGLFGMHGNAFEWCLDVWHPDYVGAPSNGEAWLEGGLPDYHIVRGGSFWSLPGRCRSAYRNACNHPQGHYDFGFRVVRTLD